MLPDSNAFPGNLIETQTKQLRQIREQCIRTGKTLGLPPAFFKAAEGINTVGLVEQMLTALVDSNAKILDALEKSKAQLHLAAQREAALRVELSTKEQRHG